MNLKETRILAVSGTLQRAQSAVLPRIPRGFIRWWRSHNQETQFAHSRGGLKVLVQAYERGAADQLQADRAALETLSAALYRALPFLEDARADPAYKKGAVAAVLREVRKAVAVQEQILQSEPSKES